MYSQNTEEEIIRSFFGNYRGIFLDIGANCKELSNTFALAEIGWCGVCVEPSPLAFACLCKLYIDRNDIHCYRFAVSDFNGKATFYDSGTHLNKGDTGLLSSLQEQETFRWTETTEFNKIEVDVVDFKTLLALSPYKQFDFISVDAEGSDITILRQMDLRRLETKLLCVEYNSKNQSDFDGIVLRQGFELIHKNAENLMYAVV